METYTAVNLYFDKVFNGSPILNLTSSEADSVDAIDREMLTGCTEEP